MSDDPFYLPYLPNTPLTGAKPRPPEKVFEFELNGRIVACELRYHREYGVEAVFLKSTEFFASRRFNTRQQAVQWAELERQAMQNERCSPH